MAGANVKIGVSGVSQFKQGINEAKQAVKTFDAQLALCEKQFKATGDQESYLAMKSELLKGKLEAQKTTVEQMEKALDSMQKNGVERSSTAYQNLYQQMLKAKGEMIDTSAEAEKLGTAEENASGKAGSLTTQLQGIGKGVAFENVTSGIKAITEKLEDGARAAINFAKKVARSAMDSTEWADDILTRSLKYGIDPETLQRMENAAAFVDTDVDTILSARSRLAKNKDSLGDLLGMDVNGKTVDEAFWEAGRAIMAMTDEFEKEEAAQKIFGKGWKDLVPLFTMGQEEYNQKLEEQNVLTNEQVKKLGEADDAIKKIQQQIDLMKNQFWAENADKIVELGQWVVDNSDTIVAAITAIGAAIGLLKIGEFALEVGKVVNGFQNLSGTAAAAAGAAQGSSWAGAFASAAMKAAPFLAFLYTLLNPGSTSDATGNNELIDKEGNLTNEARQYGYTQDENGDLIPPEFNPENRPKDTHKTIDLGKPGRLLGSSADWQLGDEVTAEEAMALITAADKMEEAAGLLTGDKESQQQSNSEMTQAANGMKGLPAETANAVREALSGVGISIDGSLLIGWINSRQATMVGQ